jgi:hypothetical protein
MLYRHLIENIFSHADCFVTFAVHFGIGNKTVFMVELYNALVVFYICVYRKEAAGKKLSVTKQEKLFNKALGDNCSK